VQTDNEGEYRGGDMNYQTSACWISASGDVRIVGELEVKHFGFYMDVDDWDGFHEQIIAITMGWA